MPMSLQQVGTTVSIALSNGDTGTYDLAIGADGIYPTTRMMIYPDAPAPAPSGQGCWCIAINRPESIDSGEFYFGGEHPAGIPSCGDTEMYLWPLTSDVGTLRVHEKEGVEMLRELLEPFGGTPGWICENMNERDIT